MSETWDDLAGLHTYQPNLIENTNLLIVDGNNLGYRYLKRKNYNSFQEDYIRTVESLAKSYYCKDIIVIYDFGKSKYRLNIFPEYKGNRSIKEEEKPYYDEFFNELNKTADNLPFAKLKFYGVEADDLISYCISNLYNRYKEVWVISSDRDMFQLLQPNVHIFSIFSKKEVTLKSLLQDKKVTTKEYRLSRIIQGDASDNIKGIEGIGEVRGQEIARNHKGELNILLQRLPLKGKSQYIRNLNNGADILRRNELLINLISYNKDIISFAGENYIQEIDEILHPFMKNTPLSIPFIGRVEEPVDISRLENLLK